MSESLSCPQCEKMDLKIIQSLLERVHICRRCWKTKNVQELEDFSEEQQAVDLLKTNNGLMNSVGHVTLKK